MKLFQKLKVCISILLILITGGGFFPGIWNMMKAGDVSMIQNDHTKSFATEFTELVAYPGNDEERQSWQQGMVTGNGENGAVCAGSPYHDTLIYQNIHFLMPTNEPRYTPDEVTAELEEARQAVINGDDTWDIHGRSATYFYAFHPGPVLRMTAKEHLYRNYIRWMDFETAEVGVKYSDIRGTWERLTFSSREDNVTITKISKSSLGAKINLTLSLSFPAGQAQGNLRRSIYKSNKQIKSSSQIIVGFESKTQSVWNQTVKSRNKMLFNRVVFSKRFGSSPVIRTLFWIPCSVKTTKMYTRILSSF